jgi:hypothetical protein
MGLLEGCLKTDNGRYLSKESFGLTILLNFVQLKEKIGYASSHHCIVTTSHHHNITSSQHHIITSTHQHHRIIASSHHHIFTSSDHRIITLKLPHSGEAGKFRLFSGNNQYF